MESEIEDMAGDENDEQKDLLRDRFRHSAISINRSQAKNCEMDVSDSAIACISDPAFKNSAHRNEHLSATLRLISNDLKAREPQSDKKRKKASIRSMGFGSSVIAFINNHGIFMAGDGLLSFRNYLDPERPIVGYYHRDKKVALVDRMLVAGAGYGILIEHVMKKLRPKIIQGMSCEQCANEAYTILKNDSSEILAKSNISIKDNDPLTEFLFGAYEFTRPKLFHTCGLEGVEEIQEYERQPKSTPNVSVCVIGVGTETTHKTITNNLANICGGTQQLSEYEEVVWTLLNCMKAVCDKYEVVGGRIIAYYMPPPPMKVKVIFNKYVDKIPFTLHRVKCSMYSRLWLELADQYEEQKMQLKHLRREKERRAWEQIDELNNEQIDELNNLSELKKRRKKGKEAP